MSIAQIHKLKVVNNWLKETISNCEYDAFGKDNEVIDINLDQHILPYLRDQEHHTFIKLTKAEDNPQEII
tara:strand:+ start:309 stop:518 length:210 start_codon:yes stop_codon:yes gene_type:complete